MATLGSGPSGSSGTRIEQAPGYADFVRARVRPMLAIARGLTRSDEDAEDLVQDVLAKVLVKWDVVRATGAPAAYANRMLVNAATSFWRRAVVRRERPTPTEETPAGLVADPAAGLAERDALLTALRELPTRQRAVLVLRYYEDMPDDEIAQLLGVAQATVRSCAARGLRQLRENSSLGEQFRNLLALGELHPVRRRPTG